jgi:replicative DNA helicase
MTPEHEDSYEAEFGLLACIAMQPDLLSEARRKIPSAASFRREAHGLIYEAMIEHIDANQPLELITFTERLRARGLLDQVGGVAAISDLWVYLPAALHFSYYLEIVWTRARLAQLKGTALRIAQEADAFGREGDETITSLVGRAETSLFELVQEVAAGQSTGTGMVTAQQAMVEWVDHLEMTIANRGKIIGLTTGIHEIDQTLHGLDDKQGEILVIAGRPGQGKTAFAVAVESHWVDQGYPGLVVSAEMSRVQYNTRLVLGSCGIDTSKGITGHFRPEEEAAILRRVGELKKARRLLNADSYITTADLRTQAQIAKRTMGIRWMIVDHLTLIKPVTAQGQKEERLGIKETMEALQWIKKELNVVVLLLVQMSRESDRNVGKPPVMADLAGSAAIEQYADHIMFLYRPSYYVPWHRLSEGARDAWIEQTGPRRQRCPDLWCRPGKYDEDSGGVHRDDYEEDAILFVRKNRRGPTPEVHVRFQPQLTWYSTRMPALNSLNPLDQQFGSYTAAKKSSPSDGNGKVKPRRGQSGGNGEDLDDIFTED